MAGGVDIATMKAILDTSGMRQGAKEGAAAMEQLTKGAEKVDAAMQSVRAGALRMAGVLGAYQFSQWIKGNIDLAARYETLGVVIQQVSKSAGYASSDINRLTDALQKQGISMMQARQSVISMIQAKLDLAKADQLAAVAQNAAVTAGLNSSETLQRIIYGITTGQTDVLRSVGIVTEFEGAYKKMAETLKKSSSDLTAAEKSQARVNAVIEAGKPIAGAYAASMDTAGKQSASMARYIEDLRLKLGQAFQPANTSLIFGMSSAVKALAENADVLVMVIGAMIARSIVPLVEKFRDAGAVMMRNRIENAAYAEDIVRTATVQRLAAEKRLADLKEEQAAIRAVAAVERQRLAEANARVSRAVPVGSLNVLGGRVAERDNAEVAFAMKAQADARNALNAASERAVVVNGQMATANAAVAATTAQVTLAQREQAIATSFVTKAIGGLNTVYNALGGWLGITLMAVAAFYTAYSAKMQKAKEEIDKNADAIKNKLEEISEKRARAFSSVGAYDSQEATNYQQKITAMSDAVKNAGTNVRETSYTFSEGIKDMLTNSGQFTVGLNQLMSQYEQQKIGIAEVVSGIDTLSARYPNMASAAERAKENVALLALKQDELNKFVKDTPSPLMAAASAMDLWSIAARGASQIQVPKFIKANLGEKGRDAEREIANLQRMQQVIRGGNKEAIRDEQDRQAAEKVAQSLIEERVKGNEKLADVVGKTRDQLASMGPVANEAIAQLRADADATFVNEQRKQSLIRANERLSGALERQLQVQRQTRSFLEQSGGPSRTRQESFNDSVTDYRNSMKGQQSSEATEKAIEQAKEFFRIQTVQLGVHEDLENRERERLSRVEKTNKLLREQASIMAGFKEIANGLRTVNQQIEDQESQLFVLNARRSGSLDAAQLNQLRTAQLLAAKTKEYKGLGLSDQMAESKAQEFVKNQKDIENLTKVTLTWRDSVKEVGQSFVQLSQVLQQAGNDNTRLLGVMGNSLGSFIGTLEKLADMKKNPDNYPKMPGSQQALAGAAGAVSIFSQGYAFGSTTPNKLVGAAGGALAGAATGAGIGASITGPAAPIGAAIGAAIGAVVGAIGGLMGAAQKGKQLEAQLKLNAEKIGQSLDSIRMTFSNDSLGAAISQAKMQFVDLRKAAEDTYRGTKNEPARAQVLAQINQLEAMRIQQLRDEYAVQLQLATQSLEARSLRAAGNDAEAARIEEMVAKTNEMTEAVKKYGADSTYVQKLRETQMAETAAAEAMRKKEENRKAFDSYASNGEFLARTLSATGNSEVAEALRQQIRNESELMEAREKNLDVSLLLAAQEAEEVERKRQRARAAVMKEQDFFMREVSLYSGSIAAQLIGKSFDIDNRMYNATSQADKDREQIIGNQELEAMKQGFRTQAVGLMNGFNPNTMAQAQVDITLRSAEAQSKLREFMMAGIITQEEYAKAMENVTASSAKAVEAVRQQQEKERNGFVVDTLSRQLDMNPLDRGTAKKIYDIQGEMSYDDAYNNAVKLRDSGTITNDMFIDFVEVLNNQFSPAVRDAAWTIQESARIMNQNMGTLQQQWGVFGTDAEGQVKDLSKLFGFDGKSIEQIKAMFTKAVPGQELSVAQLQMNQNISNFVGAWQRWQDMQSASSAQEIAAAAAESVSPRTTVAFSGVSETTAMRTLDVELSQLTVLRSIENKVSSSGGGITVQITMTGTPIVAQTPQQVTRDIADQIIPLLDEYQGRRVGVERKFTGNTTL